MTAQDYKINFAYGAKDGVYYGPNGSVGAYHRGNDRPTPTGTPIVIAGVTIGKTGATGLVSGPHLHTQAGTDKACQHDINPTPYEFKAGKVVAVGTGSQWGKYITIQVGNRYITYCHLSSTNVKVGQVIKEKNMATKADLDAIYQYGPLGRKRGSKEGEDVYLGKPSAFVLKDHYNSSEAKRKRTAEAKQLADLKAQVKTLQAELKKKPTQVDEKEAVKGFFQKLLDLVFGK